MYTIFFQPIVSFLCRVQLIVNSLCFNSYSVGIRGVYGVEAI